MVEKMQRGASLIVVFLFSINKSDPELSSLPPHFFSFNGESSWRAGFPIILGLVDAFVLRDIKATSSYLLKMLQTGSAHHETRNDESLVGISTLQDMAKRLGRRDKMKSSQHPVFNNQQECPVLKYETWVRLGNPWSMMASNGRCGVYVRRVHSRGIIWSDRVWLSDESIHQPRVASSSLYGLMMMMMMILLPLGQQNQVLVILSVDLVDQVCIPLPFPYGIAQIRRISGLWSTTNIINNN